MLAHDGGHEQGALVHAVIAAGAAFIDGVDTVLDDVGLDEAAEFAAGFTRRGLQRRVAVQRFPDRVVGLGKLRDIISLPDGIDDLARVARAVALGHQLPVARLALVVHVRVDLGRAVQEHGGLVRVTRVAREQPGAAQGGQSAHDIRMRRGRVLRPYPVVPVRDKPVALPVGRQPAAAVIRVRLVESRAILEAAAVEPAVIVARVGLAADRTGDLVRLPGIHDPWVEFRGVLVNLPAVHGAAFRADLEGARHLGRGDQGVQRLVGPFDPVVRLGENIVGDLLRDRVFRDIGPGQRDLGVGAERTAVLERELRQAYPRGQNLADLQGWMRRARGRPVVVGLRHRCRHDHGREQEGQTREKGEAILGYEHKRGGIRRSPMAERRSV